MKQAVQSITKMDLCGEQPYRAKTGRFSESAARINLALLMSRHAPIHGTLLIVRTPVRTASWRGRAAGKKDCSFVIPPQDISLGAREYFGPGLNEIYKVRVELLRDTLFQFRTKIRAAWPKHVSQRTCAGWIKEYMFDRALVIITARQVVEAIEVLEREAYLNFEVLNRRSLRRERPGKGE